jgi:hypothetical protein
LLNLTIFDENKPFRIILEYFSSAHVGFSVVGQSGRNQKKADLSLKINFFQIFRSRFGFLVQFYPYPELEIKKYAQGQELLIFGVFLKNWPTVSGVTGRPVFSTRYFLCFLFFLGW